MKNTGKPATIGLKRRQRMDFIPNDQFRPFYEFVKKYGRVLGLRILRRIGLEKTESYREYGAGFFGAKSAKSRRHQGAQLFFHRLYVCGVAVAVVALLCLGGCSDEAVGAGTLACVPGEPLRCDQTFTKVLRCSGETNAWVVDTVCSATQRCEEAVCVEDPGNPFIGGGGGSAANDTQTNTDDGTDIDEFLSSDTN